MRKSIKLADISRLDKPYILMIDEINTDIENFLRNSKGVSIENLQNPDNIKIAEIKSIIGDVISFDLSKVGNHVYKMVAPSRLNLKEVASRLCFCIDRLRNSCKSEMAVNNAYFKFLCWMHFEFSDMLKGNKSGDMQYYGNLSIYTLMMLYIVSGIGVNVSVVSSSSLDDAIFNDLNVCFLRELNCSPVTDSFRLSASKTPSSSPVVNNSSSQQVVSTRRPNVGSSLVIPAKRLNIGTNLWLKGDNLDEIFTPYTSRVVDNATKSAFIRVIGVSDRTTYNQELYDMYDSHKERVTIINSDFKQMTPNDISALRNQYKEDDIIQYILKLCLSLGLDAETYSVLSNELIGVMDKFDRNKEQVLLNLFFNIKSVIRGVSLKDRYYLYFLETRPLTQIQIYSLYLLSCIMFDVVIFNPNMIESELEIPKIYSMNFPYKIDLKEFPTSNQSLVVETTAYNAENELTSMLYDGSAGIFRDNQFTNARVAYLKPMNEEIDILWDKDLNLRQGFSVSSDTVTMPVIFAELLGVKDGDINKWNHRFATLYKSADVIYNSEAPLLTNDMLTKTIHSAEVIKNKKIDVNLLMKHRNYPYSYLSNDIQSYMISKLQELLDIGVIEGVYTRGVENEIFTTFVGLNHNEKLIRFIQNFDFTKANPKVMYTWMDRAKIPRSDIIALHYLNLLGFDILVFVPTGYNVLDGFITKKLYTEYKNGNGVEPFTVRVDIKQKLINKFFRR